MPYLGYGRKRRGWRLDGQGQLHLRHARARAAAGNARGLRAELAGRRRPPALLRLLLLLPRLRRARRNHHLVARPGSEGLW